MSYKFSSTATERIKSKTRRQRRKGKINKGIWFTSPSALLMVCLFCCHAHFASCKCKKSKSHYVSINKWRDPREKVGNGGESELKRNLKFIVCFLSGSKTCLFFYGIVKQDILRCPFLLGAPFKPLKSPIDYAISFARMNERSRRSERKTKIGGSFIAIYGIWKSKKCQSGEINTCL